MNRAITSTCLAIVLLLLGGNAFAGKPTIAVLGLEVKDDSGTPTPQDTDTAKKLTEVLRGRAKLGTGPYAIAGNSDKELIDEKLLKNCDSEADKCMSQIGNELGADWLMFGRIEKKAGQYVVSLKLLDVHGKRTVKSSTDPLPMSQAGNDADLGEWAKKEYAKLTGEKTSGTIAIKVTNADRGTILVNDEPKGTITNGTGQVAGLDEKTYKVAIESEGFRRWESEVTVKAGETASKSVTLEKNAPVGGGTGGVVTPPGGGTTGGTTGGTVGGGTGGGGGGGSHGSGMWKGVFVGSLVVGLAGGGLWLYGKSQIDSATNDLCKNGYYPGKAGCATTSTAGFDLSGTNSKGDSGHTKTVIGSITVGVGGMLALVAFYEGFIAKHDDGGSEHAQNGHRVRRDRFVVTPIVSPTGGGATLQFDW